MKIELFAPSLGSLDLTSSVANETFALMVSGFDMGLTQANLTAIEAAFGDIQTETGYTDRTPTFHVACAAADETARVAGGEAIARWLNADDCELRYTSEWGQVSCLLVLSGYVAHVAAPSNDDDKFITEWKGVPLRWYEVHLTAAPQVLAAEVTSSSVSGPGVAAGLVEVDGTFPAAASITVTGDTGLGKTVIYASDVDYAPALRAHLTTSAGTLARSSAAHFFKGSTTWERLGGTTFTVAASDLPAGDYAFVVNAYNANGSAIACLPLMTVTTTVGGYPADSFIVGSMGSAIPGSSEALMSLGGATIDRAGISDGAESSTSITITVSNVPSDIYFDEIFAFRIDPKSSLTMLDAGDGTPALGLAHSLASVSCSPRPGDVPMITRGLASDPSKSLGGAPGQMEAPMLTPGDTFLYVACAGADTTVTAQVDYRSAHATYADHT